MHCMKFLIRGSSGFARTEGRCTVTDAVAIAARLIRKEIRPEGHTGIFITIFSESVSSPPTQTECIHPEKTGQTFPQ